MFFEKAISARTLTINGSIGMHIHSACLGHARFKLMSIFIPLFVLKSRAIFNTVCHRALLFFSHERYTQSISSVTDDFDVKKPCKLLRKPCKLLCVKEEGFIISE